MSKEETSIDKGLRNTEFIAKFFGRTKRHIQQLTTDGVLPAVKRTHKDGNLYDLIPTIQRYIKYLQGIVDNRSKSTEDLEAQKLNVDIKLKEAKAEKAILDLKILKADVLQVEDVRAYVEDLAATTKALLTALPGRLAMDVLNVQTAAEVSEIIDVAITEILNDLKDYEFSIDFYKQRVAERNGRSVDEHEDEEE